MFRTPSYVTVGESLDETITVTIVTIDVTITDTGAVTIDLAMKTGDDARRVTTVVEQTLLGYL